MRLRHLRCVWFLVVFFAATCWRGEGTRAEEEKPIWLAVARPGLAGPLDLLAQERRNEGMEVVVSTAAVEKAVAALPRRPAFLLLVGDDEPGKEAEPWYLAAKRKPLYRWRRAQPRQFASDAAWGDLDADGLPDVPVGRIPARTPAQVELAVKKILAFQRKKPTAADLQLAVWAGSPQYGAAIDTVASEMLLVMLKTTAPRWAAPWVISGNRQHPLCGWPPDQPALFTRRMREGSVLNVLMGHASAERFFSMSDGDRPIWYTAEDAAGPLEKGPPAAPMVLFSCTSGDFTRPAPCMAESFLMLPGGPMATIAATTESHPLTNYFSSVCLLKELGSGEDRLGLVWLAGQQKARKARSFLVERVLRDVEGKLEDEIDVEKLRRDQLLMYALLGDPATRLRLPKPLVASAQRTAEGWRWKAQRPVGATRLEVGHRAAVAPRDALKQRPAGREEARKAFEEANAALAFAPLPSPPDAGPWEGTVERPGWLRLVATGGGEIHVAVLKLP